jgi:hypothetical protein
VGLWSPGSEGVQGIGGALRAHWTAAKKVAESSPFFRRSGSWLEAYRSHLTAGEGLAAPTAFGRPKR